MQQPKLISVVISTYNWPEALRLALLGLNQQTNRHFEVIVADDGSGQATTTMINKLQPQLNYKLIHVWQEDHGFQVAQIRNKAIAQANGDYMVFLDQDCIPCATFIAKHYTHAEPGYFTIMSRLLLNKQFTQEVIKQDIQLAQQHLPWLIKQWRQKKINRLLPMLPIKIGPLRYLHKNKWQGTKNYFGIWQKDLVAVNGYDETYAGWGHEDSDLVVRLLQHGIKRKSAKFGTQVYHLYHPENARDQQGQNWQRLQNRINGTYTECVGLKQYM